MNGEKCFVIAKITKMAGLPNNGHKGKLPEWFADRMTALLFHSGSALNAKPGQLLSQG
jgi:hypothetical protein